MGKMLNCRFAQVGAISKQCRFHDDHFKQLHARTCHLDVLPLCQGLEKDPTCKTKSNWQPRKPPKAQDAMNSTLLEHQYHQDHCPQWSMFCIIMQRCRLTTTKTVAFYREKLNVFWRKVLWPNKTKIELLGYNDKNYYGEVKLKLLNLITLCQLSSMVAVASYSLCFVDVLYSFFVLCISTWHKVDGILKVKKECLQILQLNR